MSEVQLSPDQIVEALELHEVDGRGLERTDRELLHAIAGKFEGGPVGLSTLAVAEIFSAEKTNGSEAVFFSCSIAWGSIAW